MSRIHRAMAPFGARTEVWQTLAKLLSLAFSPELQSRSRVCTGLELRGMRLPSQVTCDFAGGATSSGAAVLQHKETITLVSPPPLDLRGDALFLDLDGTLVDFAAHPEQVVASDELRLLLASLSREMTGAIALITGRTIASADAVLDGALVHVSGIHGIERRAGQTVERTFDDNASIKAALVDARTLIAKGALQVDIEDKGLALALHYRRAPEFADATRRAAADIAQRHGLSVLEGKMVIELKLGQRTKADAVADFMAAPPFADRKPIAIGDDITDEDAFEAVLKLGGHSILVGDERKTAARFRLPDTSSVFAWLKAGLTP